MHGFTRSSSRHGRSVPIAAALVALGLSGLGVGCSSPRARGARESALEAGARSTAVVPTDGADAPAAGSAAAAEGQGSPVHGSLTSRYRARAGAGTSDQDLYETLVLDVGDERHDAFSAHFVGRLTADLDGRSDARSQSVYGSLADGFDDPVHAWLYLAYVDVERMPLGSKLRIGRQIDYLTPEFAHFDGLRLTSGESGPLNLSGGLFGGVPVRLYDATSLGDSIFGAWGESRPWTNGRVRVDWMHVEDEDRFGENSDDLLGLTWWQRLSERARLDARYTRLEERDRDLRLRANWNDSERGLDVQASYFRLLETQRNFANEFDPFFETLQSYYPFEQIRVQASKALSERTRVEGGLDLRHVDDGDDVGPYNRDFDREWLSLVLSNRWWEGFTLTLTGDLWHSDGRDIDAWAIDATREFAGRYRVSLGSSYSLYEYDYFLDTERDNVRLWYLRLRREFERWGSLDLRYDYENFDGEDFNVLWLGATWRF